MEYLKTALGVKQGKGQVLGSSSTSSSSTPRPSPNNAVASSTMTTIPAAAAATTSSFDVTFGEADTQLGMTITFDTAGRPLVGSVVPGGAANQKGVCEGDAVMSVDGNPVANYESLEVALCAMERPVVFSFRRPAAMTTSPSRHRSTGSDADEQRRRAMLAAAEERSKAYERKMGKGGSSNGRGSKKSGEGLDKFTAKDDAATLRNVEHIKRFEAEQAAALGYNPYESQSMSRAQAQARIELSAPAPSVGHARLPMMPPLPPSSSLPYGDPFPSSSSSTTFSSPPFLTPDAGSGPYIPPLSQEEYESPEAFKANEEADVAMATMLDQPLEKWRTAVNTILRILVNVLQDPFQDKYRRVRLQNPTFQAKVSAVVGALDLLHAAGFGYVSEGDETFLALPSPAPEVPLQTCVIYQRLRQILNDTQEDSRLG